MRNGSTPNVFKAAMACNSRADGTRSTRKKDDTEVVPPKSTNQESRNSGINGEMASALPTRWKTGVSPAIYSESCGRHGGHYKYRSLKFRADGRVPLLPIQKTDGTEAVPPKRQGPRSASATTDARLTEPWLQGFIRQAGMRALQVNSSAYRPISSRTYFTGGLP